MTEPCDLLVEQTPAPATNAWIVANDRRFAEQVAMHIGRYRVFECGGG